MLLFASNAIQIDCDVAVKWCFAFINKINGSDTFSNKNKRRKIAAVDRKHWKIIIVWINKNKDKSAQEFALAPKVTRKIYAKTKKRTNVRINQAIAEKIIADRSSTGDRISANFVSHAYAEPKTCVCHSISGRRRRSIEWARDAILFISFVRNIYGFRNKF